MILKRRRENRRAEARTSKFKSRDLIVFSMVSIAQIAETIEDARRTALPSREMSAVNDVMFQLRRELTDERETFDRRFYSRGRFWVLHQRRHA
jgi:hypothetical protein